MEDFYFDENAEMENFVDDELIQSLLKQKEAEEAKIEIKEIQTDSDDIKKGAFSNDSYSGLNLFKFEYDELPKFLDPIFPEVGLVSLVGSSDTGKSTLLRQLALTVSLGYKDFLGYEISSKAKNVIYISTEDDPASTSISIKKQIEGLTQGDFDKSNLNNIKFIFDADIRVDGDKNLFNVLLRDLSSVQVDLIVVDAFTDLFSGDLNSSTKVREFLNLFSHLSKQFNCLILFLHHTGKRTDKFMASKDNVLGSQAFEAKMRVLLELKHFPNDDTKRTLTITKGNYISHEIKKFSKIIRFDENDMLFYEEGQILSSTIPNLAKTNPKKNDALPIIEKLHSEGLSIRKITTELKLKGFNLGKSTVDNYIKELKLKTENSSFKNS